MGGYLSYSESELEAVLRKLMDIHDNIHALSLHSVLENKTVASVVAGASSSKQLKETLDAYETAVSFEQLAEAKHVVKQDIYKEHRN